MTTGFATLNTAKKVSGVCIVIVAISAFLPWASVLGISVSGIGRDGSITLACALIAAAMFVLGTSLVWPPKIPRVAYLSASGALAAIVALVGIVDMNNFAAIGLYLTMIGGIVWVGSILADVRQVSTAVDKQPTEERGASD